MSAFDAGVFTVGTTGTLNFDYLFDGGGYQGQLAIFNLQGMEQYTPGSTAFIQEAARRALTQSNLGHVVLDDIATGARFVGNIPWEGNSNRGTYSGIKTVTMNPGDQFGLMLVPNNTIQYIYNNPTATSNGARPVFSLGTPDTRDTLTGLQMVDVIGDDTVFAWEDIKFDGPNSDRDYNDFIFQMTGAVSNYDTALLNDNINPERDWRNTTVGQQILNYLNTQSPFDTSPPTITGALTDDTGASNTDRITKDPTISGLLTDDYTITDFRAGFDNTPTSNFVSVLADRQPNGSFTFNRTRLELLYGSTLPEGTHTLHLKATDQFGNVSNVLDIPFTLDSTPPITFFDLDVASDTTPVGDRTTTNNSVTLTGQTQPDAVVKLLETNATAQADTKGKFSFSGVSLNLGTNTFTVQATDIAGNTSTISRTITRERVPLNQAPAITSKPDTEVYYYKPYTYKVTATDPENDPLTYSLVSPATGTMAGMSIDSQGLLSWTPNYSGNYSVTVRVSDNFGNQTDQTYTLKVTGYAYNRPPVFTSVPVVSATYQEQYTYQAIAKDPDYYSDLTYSLVEGPANMSVQSNGLVSWKPEGFQAGIHPVTIKATDNYGATAIQSFNIAVGGMAPGNNSPLIVSDRETQAYTTRPYTYQVKALDPDNHTLRYSLVKSPAGMTVDANTGKIYWDKPVASGQPYDVAIQVQDGFGGIDTQSFQLTVSSAIPGGQIVGKVWEDLNSNNSQDSGERGLANVKVYLDANNNAQLDVGEKTVTTDATGSYRFTDLAAGDYIVRQITPSGFVQNPAAFSYGPNLIQNGSFELGPALPSDSNGKGIAAGSTEIPYWNVKLSDVDYTTSYYWQASDGRVSIDLNGWRQGAVTQVINTTPGQMYQVAFDLSYNPDASYERAMSVRAGGQSKFYTLPYDGHSHGNMNYLTQQWKFVADTPTTELGFYSETGGSYGAVIDKVDVRAFNTTVLHYPITLAAGEIASNKNFSNKPQDTTPTNRQPNFTSTAPTTAPVGQTWRYQALATDPDSDTLTYELTSFPDGMTVDKATGLIAWKPTPEQLIGSGGPTLSSGVYDVGVRVSDGKGGLNSQFFQVQVTSPDSNSSPVFITSSPKTAATVGQPYQFTFKALDPEGDAVTYSSPNAFTFGASLNPNTGEINWTPTGFGQADFIINATDTKGASTVKTFTIGSVSSAANIAPTIASVPSTVVAPGQVYQYQIVASDPNNDPLTYSLTSAPSGMQLNSKGRITWTPTAANLGKNAIQINVSDGRGGVANQTYELEVKNLTDFKLTAPKITSTPKTLAAVGNEYRYTPTVSNPDNDFLVFTLDSAPAGMVVDPATGTLIWTPTANQTTNLEVALTVIGNRSGSYTQKYTLALSPINTPPQILSNAVSNATVGRIYRYKVAATDRDGDRLTYSLAKSPAGMKIDPDSGLIEWTPPTSNWYDVSVKVEDGNGGIVTQDYWLGVGTSIVDIPPQIISEPVIKSAVGQTYQYQVTGIDPTGTAPVRYYFYNYPPNNMTINSDTGLITWNPTASDVGSRDIAVAAYSSYGTAYQTFSLSTINNTAPAINSTPVATVTAGATYSYDVVAVDADNDALSYNLLNPPPGMSIDKFGKITWKTGVSDIGNKPIQIAVSDGRQQPVIQNYTLAVVADNEVPKVNLVASKNFVDKGDKVTFQVSASDNVSASNLSLKVNGNPVVLDKNGLAIVTMAQAGNIEAQATATDPSGNQGSSSKTVRVIDPTDNGAPNVKLDLSGIVNGIITAPTNIKGTVSDANLDRYTLSVSPLEGGEEKVMFSGTQNVNNGVLGKLDSSILQNGSYLVKLTAIDKNGQINEIEDTIDVAGELKLGNFRLSFTDLSIPVAGIPINVTRTYDSLNANSKDDFGYGWRLDLWDTDLRTSVPRPDELEQEMGIYHPFKEGTRVYVTLPGGKREGFTFKPRKDSVSSYLIAAAGNAGIEGDPAIYHPEFVPDKGVTSQLTVEDAYIIRGGNTNQFYGLYGVAYNPSDPYFGAKYKLTTKDGVVCEIDGYTGDLVTITDTNGNKLTFSEAGIKSDTGKSVTFGRDAQGRITSITDFDGKQIKYQYDANSDLIGVTDRENNTTTFEYKAPNFSHFLTEINDPLGRPQVRTEYDEKGRLKKQLDVNGKDVEFIYDPNNFTQTVLDVFDKPTTYVYDSRGNILQEIDAKGGITKRTYDEDNNLLSEIDPDGVVTKYTYDSQGNTLTIEDGDNNITRMTYGKFGRVQSIVSPTGLTVSSKYNNRGNLIESTDSNGLTTKYTYNSAGLLTRQVSPDGQTTEWGYDTFGNPNRMVDSRGNEVKAIYDPNGRVQNATTQFSLNGQTYNLSTSFTYDKEGRILSNSNSQGNTQSTIYNSLGQITSTTDILGNVTSYRYNEKGLLTEITLPDNTPDNPNDNPKISKKYDAADRLTEETSTTGLITKYVYDELGRLTETLVPDLTPNNWDDNPKLKNKYTPASRLEGKTDIFGNWENFEYDNLGRLKREKDILGNYTSYTYNKGGQLTSITDPRLRTTHFTYDEKARLTETLFFDNSKNLVTYDSLGRVATSTNELGQTTRYEYDPYSQNKAIINPLNERIEYEYDHRRNLVKVTDALGQITRYQYDSLGRQIATIYHNGDRSLMQYDRFNRLTTVTDENLHTTKYSYNNLNQLTSLELANNARTNYTYDNLGRLKKVEDANHNFTEYEYDAFNRTTATVLPLLQRDLTVYDKFGQVKSYTDFNGDTINYTYDPYGRLNRKSFTNPNIAPVSYTYDPVTSQMLTVTDGRGETKYTYDNRERLQSITQPDGKKVQYGYDLLSNLTSLTTPAGTIDYAYDSLNRLDKVKQGAEILADYDYNKVGNLQQTVSSDGTTETRQYDQRNRLTNIQTKNTVGNIVSSYTYTLDGVGNRKRVVENTGRTVDYTYDEVDRLTEEKITDAVAGNRTIGYSYDLVGNRLSRNDSVDGLTNYTYDANDRLLQTTQEQFTYDNNGSLKTRSKGTSTTTYDWINDGENRLVGVTSTKPGSTSNIKYIYDAAGNRVASIADGVRTNYLVAPIWNLPQVLTEYDANGQVTSDYTYGLNLVRSRSGGNEKFYHTDGLGSTRMLTDTTGLITDRYNYDAFGVLLSPANTSFNAYQFAGERRDSGTGLDYLRARYYDSSSGRFVSKDAFTGFLNDPMSQHDYQYAHANPVVNTDPTGYFTLGDVLNTITTASQLALIGSTSFAGGYITAGIISGANAGDVQQMVSDFAAGFASGISGGYLTDVYESYSGQKVEARHGVLWGAGNLAGISSSFLIGMKLPTYMTNTVSSTLRWTAVGATGLFTGLDVYGAAQATVGLADGKWEWQDTWNLLAYVPFVGMFGSLKRGFGATRDLRNPVGSINEEIKKVGTGDGVEMRTGGCFVAGTEILTSEGEKDIEDIQVGDWVIADDPTTPGEIEAKQVLETFVRETEGLVDLYVDGEVISTTNEHPFWVPDKGWVEAKDLQVGSLLQTEDGRIIDVDKVEKRSGQFEVYNFKVEGFHTYFVSDLGILVHNTSSGGSSFWDDVPEDDLDEFVNSPRIQPSNWATRTAQHAWDGHQREFINVGIHSQEELANQLDSIVTNYTERWVRVRNEVTTYAYVDSTGIVVINNPVEPTAFIPDQPYDQYLGGDGFRRLQ